MADYAKEMKALEGLMKQEDLKKSEAKDDYRTSSGVGHLISTFSGGGGKGMQEAWTGGARQDMQGATDRRKDLMAKYKMMGSLQGKQMDREYKANEARDLIDYRIGKEKTKAEAKAKSPKKLSAANVLKVNEGNAIPKTLDTIADTIETNKEMFGPIEGRRRSYNPWDTQAQVLDAEIRAASQQFGRFMEGGVLRKEDEAKYRKMFPAMSDTKDIAEGKLDIVRKLLRRKQDSDLKALAAQNFDLTGLALPEQAPKKKEPVAPRPPTIAGAIDKGVKTVGDAIIPSAQAGQVDYSTMSDEQIDALYNQRVGR